MLLNPRLGNLGGRPVACCPIPTCSRARAGTECGPSGTDQRTGDSLIRRRYVALAWS